MKKLINKESELEQERLIFSCSTVFPFDFIPDTLEIREQSVAIVDRYFLFSQRVISLPIHDLISVDLTSAFFFGGITLQPPDYLGPPKKICYLKRNDAIKAARLIAGIQMAKRQDQDISEIEINDLIPQLEEIGESQIAL